MIARLYSNLLIMMFKGFNVSPVFLKRNTNFTIIANIPTIINFPEFSILIKFIFISPDFTISLILCLFIFLTTTIRGLFIWTTHNYYLLLELLMVRVKGLEPIRFYAPGSKPGLSANSSIPAYGRGAETRTQSSDFRDLRANHLRYTPVFTRLCTSFSFKSKNISNNCC